MLLKKLRLAVGAVMVVLALGAVGLGYQQGGGSGAAQAAPPDKPRNEAETLRRENELLKLNLEVVLEKVRAQETELRTLRGRPLGLGAYLDIDRDGASDLLIGVADGAKLHWRLDTAKVQPTPDPLAEATKEVESAAKALREAKDKEGKRRAAEALDKATKKLSEQLK